MTKRLAATGGFLSLIALTAFVLAVGSASADPAHWPQWRGPFFNGVARTAAPVEFGDTKNIKWKIEVPGRGFSTPVIWGDRIFLTTAAPTGKGAQPAPPPEQPQNPGAQNPEGRRRGGGGPGGGVGVGEEQKFVVMCLDKKTGKTIWERVAKTATPHEGYHRQYGSFASNAPLTDGRYLYVSFGSRGIYCYDLNGKLIWEKDLGVQMRMRNQFGEGVAPALHGNLLIHPYDQESGSFVVALDKRNGKEVWRASRDEISAWSTPLIADVKGKKQVVISATKKVRAYNPEDGKLIWECAGLGSNVIPHPTQHNDTVLVMSGHRDPKLMAVRLGREGDLTGSDAILWSQTRGTSYTASPVLHDNKFYSLTDNGMLSCFNATSGEPYYHQQRLPQPDNFKASPIAAGGNLYLASESGVVTVIKMGEKFEIVATNTLTDHMFVASPVVAEGELFLRSKTHLFCVSDGKTK
ncbi:MAG TPA: PQQ-binding-like beta-propeller repeat protein [Blastocatellia bacterium]|nr:PQQ-binding-like beta-propeller repeat protein [Blastocatellia bacterium]